MSGSRRPRSAFTLLEVTVFMAVGILVMGGAWSFFQASIRKGKATDQKAEGLQTTLLFARTVEKDLEMLYEGPGYEPRRVQASDGIGIQFWRYGPASPAGEWGPLPVARVTYIFNAPARRVFRQENDGPQEPLYGFFERADFRLDPDPTAPPPAPSSEAPADQGPFLPSIGPGGPAPAPASAPVPRPAGARPEARRGPSIVITAVAVSREALRKPLEERSAKDRTILVAAVPRSRRSADDRYSFWNPIPFNPP